MKKSEMIDSIAKTTGLSKANVEEVYNATFELFKDELVNGNNISVAGFGIFKVSNRSARTGRNPRTGETMQIAASKSVSFKASSTLKNELNN